MSFPLSSLGSIGLGGGGGSDMSAKSSSDATSGAVRLAVDGGTIASGAGNRGFQNFVTFSGAVSDIGADTSGGAGINQPAFKLDNNRLLIAIAIVAVVVIVLTMGRK